MEQPSDLMTAGEVAALLRCSLASVYRYAEDGTLPALRLAGIVRFRRSEVDALVAAPSDGDAA